MRGGENPISFIKLPLYSENIAFRQSRISRVKAAGTSKETRNFCAHEKIIISRADRLPDVNVEKAICVNLLMPPVPQYRTTSYSEAHRGERKVHPDVSPRENLPVLRVGSFRRLFSRRREPLYLRKRFGASVSSSSSASLDYLVNLTAVVPHRESVLFIDPHSARRIYTVGCSSSFPYRIVPYSRPSFFHSIKH